MVLERPLYWHYPHYGNQGGNPSSIIQENGWKLIHYWEDGSNELYDLRADPGEQYNVAAKNPDTTENMAEKLLDWLTQVGANMPEMDKEYNADLAKKYQEKIIDEMLPALEESRKEVLSEDFAPNLDWWGSQVTRD
jgi:arylsulfatase A-like enzyme